MSEKFKLGLSRNRLFEFDNCVSFLGECEEAFELSECEKALKTLLLKEPLLCCGVELYEDGQAYLVTERNQISLECFQGDAVGFLKEKRKVGIDFSKNLFSFVILNGNTLGIFAHTVVADARSLLYLAKEFMNIYKSKSFSVVPSEIKVLSEISQMPSNVFSVVVDRLASGLEVGWQKKTKVFSTEDYRIARNKYLSAETEEEITEVVLDKEIFENVRSFAAKRNVDTSSLVAFAFYDALAEVLGGRRKYRKMNVQANERVFFEEYNKMQIGAFNGFVPVEKKKNKGQPDTLESNAVSFHQEIYKRVTSAFKVFYGEFLFMRLPESFADSQYMYCAGAFEHKYSKKLACTYGCANKVMGEFCSFNLNQSFWSDIERFKSIVLCEPLKMRSSSLITFVEKGDAAKIYFDYRKNDIPDSKVKIIIEKANEILKNLK